MIVVGGVIPAQDFEALRAAGADAIFPPGTMIAEAAVSLLERVESAVGLCAEGRGLRPGVGMRSLTVVRRGRQVGFARWFPLAPKCSI